MQVRITQNLLNQVHSLISDMRGTELTNTPLPFAFETVIGHRIGTQAVIDLVWGNHLHLRDQMPKEWLVKTEAVVLHFAGATFEDSEGQIKPATLPSITFYCNGAFLPPNCNSYRQVIKADLEHSMLDGVRADINDWMAVYFQREDINKRWYSVSAQVKKFLSSYTSLNKAIKEWEGIKRFIPQHFLDDVERKAERSSSDRKPAVVPLAVTKHDIDIDNLEAAGVIGTLLVSK
jgi:hypothetical protein